MDPNKRLILPRAVQRAVVDRTAPAVPGSVYRASPEDIMLAAARMRRDGQSREAIMKALDVGPHTGVDNATMDRFLDRGEELLNIRIAQGMEPAETRVTVDIPIEPDAPPPLTANTQLYGPGESEADDEGDLT